METIFHNFIWTSYYFKSFIWAFGRDWFFVWAYWIISANWLCLDHHMFPSTLSAKVFVYRWVIDFGCFFTNIILKNYFDFSFLFAFCRNFIINSYLCSFNFFLDNFVNIIPNFNGWIEKLFCKVFYFNAKNLRLLGYALSRIWIVR
jgi:hypothetical protein